MELDNVHRELSEDQEIGEDGDDSDKDSDSSADGGTQKLADNLDWKELRNLFFSKKNQEEKSAYEARGQITGIQVAMDNNLIKRIRFAFKHTFEEWRATTWAEGDTYLGEGGEEQDPFLLEEGERVVEVTTYTDDVEENLKGLELVTTSGRVVFWGKKSGDCKRSVTKEAFLAFCSGGVMGFVSPRFSLTFHWEQNKPTSCT